LDEIKNYLDQLFAYNKLIFTKKIGDLTSYLTLLMIIAFLAVLIMMFLSFGFVWWYSSGNPEEMFIGFLIVAAFYAILALIIFMSREWLIFKPIRKALGNIIFNDTSSNLRKDTFESSEMLDAKITFAKEGLKNKEEKVSGLISELGEVYTIENIGKHFLQNIYYSFVTTSNVAKIVYNFVKKLKKKQSTKRNRNSEIKDSN
jgi:hypothetical protein